MGEESWEAPEQFARGLSFPQKYRNSKGWVYSKGDMAIFEGLEQKKEEHLPFGGGDIKVIGTEYIREN